MSDSFERVARVFGSKRTGGFVGENDKKQVGGDHYKNKKIQPWDAMESWMTPDMFEGYLGGNVVKYIARYRDKDGVRDLKKAAHYLERLISQIEKRNVGEQEKG